MAKMAANIAFSELFVKFDGSLEFVVKVRREV